MKCYNQLHYMGHIVSAQGIAPDPTKLQVVVNWPQPSTVTDLRGFLVLVYVPCIPC